jgi:hypothetical protein
MDGEFSGLACLVGADCATAGPPSSRRPCPGMDCLVTSRRAECCPRCVAQRAALQRARGARFGVGAELVELVRRAARMAAARG